jgi:pimeloyl-ACP methyl ester carboxylesterase
VLLPDLARTHWVIAPDLLGHGLSDTPRGDYSIPAHANDLRDLLGALGVRRATVIGHSLGGGLAMQLAYQFPHLVERLVLVAPGGVTRDVHQLLRLMALPGGDGLLALVRVPAVRAALRWSGRRLAAARRRTGLEIFDVTGALDALSVPGRQRAFVRTLRSVIDWQGQVVSMLDRNQLPDGMPVLLVWGDRDPIIPVAHAELAREAIPGSMLEVFPDAGHFPYRTDPVRFLAVVREFLGSTPQRDRPGQLQPLVEPQPSQT